MMAIPSDLREFLSKRKNLEIRFEPGGEIDRVTLNPVDDLIERPFAFMTPSPRNCGGQECKLQGVDLVKDCPHYSPDGILIWFPVLASFGSWDCDHHTILIFPGIAWSDVIRNPSPFQRPAVSQLGPTQLSSFGRKISCCQATTTGHGPVMVAYFPLPNDGTTRLAEVRARGTKHAIAYVSAIDRGWGSTRGSRSPSFMA
jgi:hypothetical protein